ncbi:DAK2 domain-containing protein [Atopobacter phocae]|uniref:DAK2 domain-containing protein n=1 Tax=Atopobacter phocae TaxID=136492 RepID=UPI000471346D|nr:DAK2 domain-containing protein [Atopobacter phocae]
MVEKATISVTELKDMIQLGAERLNEQAEYVNSLNVFPVPDGDTGTNMSLSFSSGTERVFSSNSETISEVVKDLAKGLLMGARGNSGVILSQIFRGFSQSLEHAEVLNASELARAFQGGVDTAYKAVMKPVEGTILTVARESAKRGMRKAEQTNDCVAVLESVLNGAQKALEKTPDLLPVLKEVGVVDSGGQGLVYIYEGFYEALTGKKPKSQPISMKVDLASVAHHDMEHASTGEIKFGYCTEIMVHLGEGETVTDEFDHEEFRNYLNELGDSLLVVNDDEVVKVHVHTEYPGKVMNYGQRFGSLMKVKVDNMRLQNDDFIKRDRTDEVIEKFAEKKPYAIIAISSGEGLNELFKSMGVTNIISGGQTMNPSTEVIVKEIERANAEQVIILPNNKNIFMAAKQAQELMGDHVGVIETKSLTEGLAVMLSFSPDQSLTENMEAMNEAKEHVLSAQITTSIRSTQIDGVDINENDFMGIIEGKIKVSEPELKNVLHQTIESMLTEDHEIVTLIIGEDGSEEIANEVVQVLEEQYDDYEFEIHQGDQPVYHYLISVE